MTNVIGWTAERVADRVRELADVHGTPNRFQLHEVVGDSDRKALFAVSRLARIDRLEINGRLAAFELQAAYQARNGRDCPAYIMVTAMPIAPGLHAG